MGKIKSPRKLAMESWSQAWLEPKKNLLLEKLEPKNHQARLDLAQLKNIQA
jgi:hypothetical protein